MNNNKVYVSPENLAYVYKKTKNETADISLSNVNNDIFLQKAEEAGIGADCVDTSMLANYYTKSEIDGKLTTVFRYKGSVENYFDLPSDPEVGDVWNIESAFNEEIKYYREVVISSVDRTDNIIYFEDFHYSDEGSDGVIISKNFAKIYVVDCRYGPEKEEGFDVQSVEGLNEGDQYYYIAQHFNENTIPLPEYTAGDNVVWNGNNWDVLAGFSEVNLTTKEGGVALGNEENAAITPNSFAFGGGVGEEPNIAGRKSYLVCGVYENEIILEYIPNETELLNVDEWIGFAYPSNPDNPDTGWKTGRDGFGTIVEISVPTTTPARFSDGTIPETNRVISDSGMYITVKLDSIPKYLKTQHIKETYNGGAVRTKRIMCRFWSNDRPDAGVYLTSESTFTAGGKGNYASGQGTVTLGGKNSKAIGEYSIAGGQKSEAWEESSVALGNKAKAKGLRSFAFGDNVTTNDNSSLAGGYKTETNGHYTFAWGTELRTSNSSEAAFGKYNVSSDDTLFSIGNGKSSGRKNAFEIKSDGTIVSTDLDERFANMNEDYTTLINEKGEELSQQIDNLKDIPVHEIELIGSTTSDGELTGWIPLAQYTFPGKLSYHSGLIYLTNAYVATKINAIIAFSCTVVSDGSGGFKYHNKDGITLKQIAGEDISSRLAYHVDPITQNLTFYFNRSEKYCTLRVGTIYNYTAGAFAFTTGKHAIIELPTDAVKGTYVTAPLAKSASSATKATQDGSGRNIVNTYATKTELKNAVSSVYRFKGSVATYEDLPTNPEVGDVWNIEQEFENVIYGKLCEFTELHELADAGAGFYSIIAHDGTLLSSFEEQGFYLYDANTKTEIPESYVDVVYSQMGDY